MVHLGDVHLPAVGSDSSMSKPQQSNGTWLYLFDENNVCEGDGLRFRPGQVTKHGPVLVPDRPWERSLNGFGSLVYDRFSGQFRYYYNQQDSRIDGVFRQCIMMATSEDGLHWDKPELGAITFEGAKTNLIGLDLYSRGWGAVIPSIIQKGRDDWEMFFWAYHLGDAQDRKVHCLRAVSTDGVDWTVPEPDAPVSIHTDPLLRQQPRHPFDPKAVAIPDADWRVPLEASRRRSNDASFVYERAGGGYEFDGVWRASNRGPRMAETSSLFRTIQRRESRDGKTWSAPEMIIMPDELDAVTHQLYYLSVTHFEGYRLGLVGLYNMDIKNDVRTLEPQLAVSTDGRRWRRPAREALIPRGADGDYDSQMIMCPNQMLDIGDEWLVLYGASRTPHAKNPGEGEPHEGCIGLVTIPKHRLVGVCADAAVSFRTKPFFCDAADLRMDADVADGGEVRAELADPLGQTAPGFGFEDSVPLGPGSKRQTLRWKNASPRRFVGEMVSVRLQACKAHIFGVGCR